MPSQNTSPQILNLDAWVDSAASDPVRHRQRQVTHVLLHAVARTPVLRDALCLKGGILMSAAYNSIRQTGDVDFSASANPEPFTSALRETLDAALTSAAADLGYVDLRLKVQRFEKNPRPATFEEATSPAIKMTIGIALRATNAAKSLERGQAIEVLGVDISFKEPIINVQVLNIQDQEHSVFAYSIEDLIAEKLRALVQQKMRNRRRRQDIYDIFWLTQNVSIDADARKSILSSFLKKSDARELVTTQDSFDDPETRERAGADWHTMALEIGDLPDFNTTYDSVRDFYRSLPWDEK